MFKKIYIQAPSLLGQALCDMYSTLSHKHNNVFCV